jgi:hypothetical protein
MGQFLIQLESAPRFSIQSDAATCDTEFVKSSFWSIVIWS